MRKIIVLYSNHEKIAQNLGYKIKVPFFFFFLDFNHTWYSERHQNFPILEIIKAPTKTLVMHIQNLLLKLLRCRTKISFPFPNLLRQKGLMNVWQNSSISNSNSSQKLAQFFVVSHSKMYMPWNNTVLLVVSCSITSKLQNLWNNKPHI